MAASFLKVASWAHLILVYSRLFNNPSLSDIKIKQVNNSQVREYYAHRAVLCMESEYFLHIFTGNFKEASESGIELHDDEPELYELLLKFIYCNEYDKDTIVKLAGDDKAKRVLIPIGVFAIADKYDVPKIYQPAANDVRGILTSSDIEYSERIQTALHAHYGTCGSIDSAMGKTITTVILENYASRLPKSDFERWMMSYPMFAADVALAVHRDDGIRKFYRQNCTSCNKILLTDKATIDSVGWSGYFCTYCGKKFVVTRS
ncbi:hypothetical protein FB567DRAFT_434637 [Paraphoma chrysanthemicola]|uniref:BTB domain-containing protein n=1 Tax=Paraphoma chrysanthemicola TaxID=798071 RepID=A0A8K0RD47_9PLEO|nr:hypothetical protein FB567DRAFT_434637 [Paraphoma chrysanthemicola]